jgi:hypothetical protein
MKPCWESLLEIIILLPLKIIEFTLNCFAFILMAIAAPIINIIKAIKSKK